MGPLMFQNMSRKSEQTMLVDVMDAKPEALETSRMRISDFEMSVQLRISCCPRSIFSVLELHGLTGSQ